MVRIRYVVQILCIMNLFECILKRLDKSARGLLGANNRLLPANNRFFPPNHRFFPPNHRLLPANYNNMRWSNSKRRVLLLGDSCK